MGLCESLSHRKTLNNKIYSKKEKAKKVDPNEQTFDYKNLTQEESGLRPSIFNKSEIKSSIVEDIKANNINKNPELIKYDRSIFNSGKRSNDDNNKISVFSSGLSEEEIIIKGEINKEAKNKEEDFINASFKKLVKNNGGIIIEKNEITNNNNESRKQSSLFDSGKENISVIHSTESIPMLSNRFKPENKLSSIKNENNIEVMQKGIISGKYDAKGNLIPNNNRIQINSRFDRGNKNENNNLIGINNNSNKQQNNSINSAIRGSSRINVSIHESCPKIDSFLNVPKNDQPPPDLDELSENMFRNSIPYGN